MAPRNKIESMAGGTDTRDLSRSRKWRDCTTAPPGAEEQQALVEAEGDEGSDVRLCVIETTEAIGDVLDTVEFSRQMVEIYRTQKESGKWQ